MRLTTSSLLLSAVIGAAHAATKPAEVYILRSSGEGSVSDPPALSAEAARLVLAQHLRVSDYHDLHAADDVTLSHIDAFGGDRAQLLMQNARIERSQLVIIVDGVEAKKSKQMLGEALDLHSPDFTIPSSPSVADNRKLVEDLNAQSMASAPKGCKIVEGSVSPFAATCVQGNTRAMHIDLSKVKPDAVYDPSLQKANCMTRASPELKLWWQVSGARKRTHSMAIWTLLSCFSMVLSAALKLVLPMASTTSQSK